MKQYIKITFSALLCLSLLSSCDDFLEVEPEDVLLSDNYLGDDELDARSALFGVLAQMQDLYGQYMVLGEMRADLVDVNINTIEDIRDISNHNFDEDNPYVDATNLFSIINNCNFAIEGIDTEAYDGRLLDDYASILRIRTWAQLQVLIYYGKLPYIDKPIRSDDDFSKEYQLMDFDEALNQLIINLTEITQIDNVSNYDNDNNLAVYNMIPNNDILLGDLFLWRNDYVNAAISYKRFLDNQFGGGPRYLLNSFTATSTESNGTFNVDNDWGDMFFTTSTTETINYIGFDEEFKQPNKEYLNVFEQFAASESILLKWGEQFKGFEGVAYENGDNRGEGQSYYANGLSLPYGDNGQSVNLQDKNIIKYFLGYHHYRYNRASKIYLRYAEAINYAGYPEHALVVLNGIFNNPDVLPQNSIIFNEEQEEYLKFDIDDYFTVDNSNIPTGGLQGIRGRVSMAPVVTNVDDAILVTVDDLNLTDEQIQNLTIDDINDLVDDRNAFEEAKVVEEKKHIVGGLILEEAALELAFEGSRWEDLVRFSRRSGADIIANAVARKFEVSTSGGASAEEIRAKLSVEDNWFLPLDIPTNFVETVDSE